MNSANHLPPTYLKEDCGREWVRRIPPLSPHSVISGWLRQQRPVYKRKVFSSLDVRSLRLTCRVRWIFWLFGIYLEINEDVLVVLTTSLIYQCLYYHFIAKDFIYLQDRLLIAISRLGIYIYFVFYFFYNSNFQNCSINSFLGTFLRIFSPFL